MLPRHLLQKFFIQLPNILISQTNVFYKFFQIHLPNLNLFVIIQDCYFNFKLVKVFMNNCFEFNLPKIVRNYSLEHDYYIIR